ncbi:MAG: PIN domain-containing protein [Bacteroidales bacterium]|nr:PIN domain-containing protein [Bacteroidales bacterium]
MNVFIDTNIMIDVPSKRDEFYLPAARIVSLADNGKIDLFASSLSFATSSYMLSKHNKEMDVIRELEKFATLCYVTPVDYRTVFSAFKSDFSDFEDALQYFSAQRCNADVIVTRNAKDFDKSTIQVMSPQEFLNSLIGK